ncbi:SusE domain-containing protein [Xylanibacter ruminicola]|uniref:SusE outer membrane protein n=1 Tax=Xylanibacter ruminicola TaxID=839 RepID=A0A1M6ST50_XYLRU|nr:SusE domain-containing protein [Xylanibacter ruminicola]SHK47855.1 SusE outer membrane protein [Xylanibacter ruminicola]
MNKNYIKAFALFGALLTISSCTSDMEFKDTQVSAITQLYEPADGKSVTLQASSTASTYFEWEAAKAEDSGSPLYEVAFYKEGESTPIYKVLSDKNGMMNSATITHKTLNKVAAAAGFKGGASGKVSWSIIASRGLNQAESTVKHQLNITSLEGFDEIPSALYIIGDGAESGSAFSSPEQGVYEIFTKLEGGKSYQFCSTSNGEGTIFSLDGLKLREGGSTTAPATGVYRLVLDFNVASATIREIKSIGLFFCPNNNIMFDLPYAGNGEFSGVGVVAFKQEGWGRDERYKFLMEYADGTTQYWGTKNGTDSRPGGLAPEDPYYYMMETGNNQWDDKWKFDGDFDGGEDGPHPGVKTRITVIFHGANYTHHVELAN